MSSEVTIRYGLFQTLDVNIPSEDLDDSENNELFSELTKGSTDPSDAEAIFMLICEYARVYDGYNISFDESSSIPYSKSYVTNEHPNYDYESMPTHLRWVLYNFLVKNK